MHPKVEGKISWISNSTLSDLADLTFIAIKNKQYTVQFLDCTMGIWTVLFLDYTELVTSYNSQNLSIAMLHTRVPIIASLRCFGQLLMIHYIKGTYNAYTAKYIYKTHALLNTKV